MNSIQEQNAKKSQVVLLCRFVYNAFLKLQASLEQNQSLLPRLTWATEGGIFYWRVWGVRFSLGIGASNCSVAQAGIIAIVSLRLNRVYRLAW